MIKKIARDKHPRLVIMSLKVVSFTSSLDIPKKSSIVSTWHATIVSLRSRAPPFLSIHFLFLTKLWAACVQNHTSDNEKKQNKIKNPHRYVTWVILSLTFIYNLFSPFSLGEVGGKGVEGEGCYLRACWTFKKKKGWSILSTYEFLNFVLDQEPLLSFSFLFLTKL